MRKYFNYFPRDKLRSLIERRMCNDHIIDITCWHSKGICKGTFDYGNSS